MKEPLIFARTTQKGRKFKLKTTFLCATTCLLAASFQTIHALQPNDPLFTLDSDPKEYQWGLHFLNMPEVWDYSLGHAYIGVIDLGIDPTHEDLQANFRPRFSYNHVTDTSDVDELHTNVTNNAGHGTHVAGIIAATPNNGTGISGVCWHCSLMIQKTGVATIVGNRVIYGPNPEAFIEGINFAANNGAQVINLSLGNPTSKWLFSISGSPVDSCANVPTQTQISQLPSIAEIQRARNICDAIEYADSMDIVMVAAAGNAPLDTINFPSSEPTVIAVGAVDTNGNVPDWSNDGQGKDIVVPGVNILSTFYPDRDWNTGTSTDPEILGAECSDNLGALSGYGPCSGTSMATPMVSGVVGILRSINPLLKKGDIKALLTSSASHSTVRDNEFGYGIPDAKTSVMAALGTANGETLVNRLTPLFSLVSQGAGDHFYTTVPQMATAALYGTMSPQPPSGNVSWISTTGDGASSSVSGYDNFPRFQWSWAHEIPTAQVYVFTTNKTPPNYNSSLIPLYRLSYQGNTTGSNPLNIDHTYTTSQAEVDAYLNVDYQLDGIEGYIFQSEVEGTVRLFKRYNPTLDDHAIFPETILTWMESRGYTVQDGAEVLGYVYLNQDSDGDGLIDGFEDMIGTSNSNKDSDNDGISDGIEVNRFPYSDPIDTIPNSIEVQTFQKLNQPRWQAVNFSEQFADSSIILSQMQSFNGGDTASVRTRNFTNTSIELLIEEEQSHDSEVAHTDEAIGMMGLREGEITDSEGNIIGEAGILTSNTTNGNDWRTLTFSRSYSNPVVLMEMMSYNGGHQSHIRLKGITNTNAQYQIEEWDYLDGGHTTESIGYVVIEQGTKILSNGKSVQAGVASINHNWTNVSFEDLGGQNPVVFSQSQSYNGHQAIVTRHRGVISNGFQIRLQEEEANDGTHAVERVGFFVVQ